LVLMDVAPEVNHYTSDIGRMWPVDGTYRRWQRELYGYIVAYHKALLARIRPGVMPDQVMDEAAEVMAPVWERWPFSKALHREGARKTLAFRGHLSHPVGMAVHDDGGYRGRPLTPGTVFAVDPQMWIPEERLYIRVEDTVVVTENGIENLTEGAPLDLDDVEVLMRDEALDLPLRDT
jgi:Xaa-Pro aminopeptidase